jgi:uncharacterized protein YkwD
MNKVFTFFCLLLVLASFGQQEQVIYVTYDEFVKMSKVSNTKVENFSQDSLNFYFEKRYNEYRSELNLPSVSYDQKMIPVSKNQSDYCLSVNKLTHNQPNLLTNTYESRGVHFNYPNELNGECGVKLSIKSVLLLNSNKSDNYYDLLVIGILESWKNSPEHDKILRFKYTKFFCVTLSSSGDNGYGFLVVSNGYPLID